MLKEIKHSRDLVHYINRSQTYPSNNSRSLALYIADFYNPKKGYAFPSQGQMAEALGTHRPSIIRWLKEIESTGYWVIEKGGKNNSTHYFPSDSELENISIFLESESSHDRINDDIPKVETESKKKSNLPSVSVVTLVDSYVSSPLPTKFPQNIDLLKKAMLPYGFAQYKKPANFKKLSLDKQEFLNLLVSYLVQFNIIDKSKTSEVVSQMVETWLLHDTTDRDSFYNRYMHFLNDAKDENQKIEV